MDKSWERERGVREVVLKDEVEVEKKNLDELSKKGASW